MSTATISTTTTLKAHQEAVAARRRAEQAQQEADAAQQAADGATAKAKAEADARLCRDAERIVASWDADHAASEKRVAQARDVFYEQAVTAEAFADLRGAYLAWQSAASDHHLLYRGLANALGRLGQTLFRGTAIPAASSHLELPSFSSSLDTAIKRVIAGRSADLEDAFHERILAIENGEIDG